MFLAGRAIDTRVSTITTTKNNQANPTAIDSAPAAHLFGRRPDGGLAFNSLPDVAVANGCRAYANL